jgi:CRP-like cAMP-binding protein
METFSTGNALLDRLPKQQYADLAARLKPLQVANGEIIYEARAPIEYSYFPTTGVFSTVVVLSNGDMIEVATMGNEGAMGLPSFVEAHSSPNRVFCQVPGSALRVEAELLTKAAHREGPLGDTLHRYHAAFSFQVSQSVACNGRHVLSERCCRWLLMTHDRVPGDDIQLTHEYLSIMLGVRRPGITQVLQSLSEKGLIKTSRGVITVLDRQGLEAGSCECYRAVKEEYARLLG